MTEAQREIARLRSRAWRLVPGNVERERATKAAYRKANLELVKAQKLAAGRRFVCAHRQELRDAANAKRVTLRAGVIKAYGGRCNCPGCHVIHAEMLTVDHVNGGAHHRLNRRSTRDVYALIIKLKFPPDYQLLCGSCNLAKSDKKQCPLAGEEH